MVLRFDVGTDKAITDAKISDRFFASAFFFFFFFAPKMFLVNTCIRILGISVCTYEIHFGAEIIIIIIKKIYRSSKATLDFQIYCPCVSYLGNVL